MGTGTGTVKILVKMEWGRGGYGDRYNGTLKMG